MIAARERRYRPDVQSKHDLEADIGADHKHLTMGEMNEPKYAEDERIADGDQGIGATKH